MKNFRLIKTPQFLVEISFFSFSPDCNGCQGGGKRNMKRRRMRSTWKNM